MLVIRWKVENWQPSDTK